MNKPACMGGMCRYRDRCARHVTDDRRIVAERLCPRGQETPEPIGTINVVAWARQKRAA